MKRDERKVALRCAVYTRVSTNSGLEQDFNSLDNQREASEAYIKSQAHEGWKLVRERYDDRGFSGGSMERPALQKLLEDVRARKIDVIVVYKVDRLTRSLADFAKLVELFDAHGVSFISVTQAFNTITSMGRRGEATAARRTKRMSDEALATDRPPERESDAPPVERLAPVSNMAILRWIFGQP
jgi:DNA invertase Pin-like site-specific DNA recombinase